MIVSDRPVNNETVFECKVGNLGSLSTRVRHLHIFYQYEIDSLSGFVKLSRSYYEETGDDSFINDNCKSAVAIARVYRGTCSTVLCRDRGD